ncbi:unnamed protein product [Paramecium primaurelia]|uniref:Uncharacterized protein n=1 Tax=Paramecium primaurelia TaxID=5886 RepID=A0A8S1KRJ5_PARPR|nr:unnamed protein product [Paramecium primaurelia]
MVTFEMDYKPNQKNSSHQFYQLLFCSEKSLSPTIVIFHIDIICKII